MSQRGRLAVWEAQVLRTAATAPRELQAPSPSVASAIRRCKVAGLIERDGKSWRLTERGVRRLSSKEQTFVRLGAEFSGNSAFRGSSA